MMTVIPFFAILLDAHCTDSIWPTPGHRGQMLGEQGQPCMTSAKEQGLPTNSSYGSLACEFPELSGIHSAQASTLVDMVTTVRASCSVAKQHLSSWHHMFARNANPDYASSTYDTLAGQGYPIPCLPQNPYLGGTQLGYPFLLFLSQFLSLLVQTSLPYPTVWLHPTCQPGGAWSLPAVTPIRMARAKFCICWIWAFMMTPSRWAIAEMPSNHGSKTDFLSLKINSSRKMYQITCNYDDCLKNYVILIYSSSFHCIMHEITFIMRYS